MDERNFAIILFDGVCNFCNGTVNFIIKNDKENYFKFAPLQSETGQKLLEKHGLNTPDVDSVILIEDEKAFFYSTAVLKIARNLQGIWSFGYLLIYLPEGFRNFFYKLFARNRYSLFGKKDVCMMPTPEIRERFLS